ncbi:hypothetical protein GCM10023074_05260 [Microbispora amethystogenes]|uniref:Type I restriction modification DNA specificity domain-containing protein n=2 Tax=Microbispora amethystogenes TaxID=1427754 RepID=A0ABQ4F612_9ACTN|nr:hypothetical protein Mam01_04130 [Microbispora amethystogenes]
MVELVDRIRTDAIETATSTQTRPLESLLREPLRNGYSGRASADGVGVRTLTLTAVTKNQFTETNTKIATAESARVRDLWLEPGDILVQRSNTPELVGTSALFNGEKQWAVFPDLLIRVRLNSEASPDFVQLVLQTSKIRHFFKASAKGLAGSMPKIDQGTILRTPIPALPVEEQHEIVGRVAKRLAEVESLAELIDRVKVQAAALRGRLLTNAFEGRLVPQDPTDAPAEELLQRIATERTASVKQMRRPSRRTAVMPDPRLAEDAAPVGRSDLMRPMPADVPSAETQEALFPEEGLSS